MDITILEPESISTVVIKFKNKKILTLSGDQHGKLEHVEEVNGKEVSLTSEHRSQIKDVLVKKGLEWKDTFSDDFLVRSLLLIAKSAVDK